MNMLDCNSLPEPFASICQGTALKATGRRYALQERKEIISRRLRLPIEDIVLPIPEGQPVEAISRNVSGIGTRLHAIIKSKAKREIECGECRDEITNLNLMTIEEVKQIRVDLAQRMVNRAKKMAPMFWQRWGVTLAPVVALNEFLSWIDEACEGEPVKEVAMKWAYGITTVPLRLDDYFPRTLASLQNAGFETPHLFIDGCNDLRPYAKYNLATTIHWPNARTMGNWYLALVELYIREPNADRYAIFQDDFVTYRNLKKYLEKVPYPGDGYCNLYTFPKNQDLAPAGKIGWYESNQKGKGAVATVMNRECLTTLMKSDHLINKMRDSSRGHKSVDGGIVTAIKDVGWKEYVHNPSLVQHIGLLSSMQNRQHPESTSFRGEDFDALELLQK